ncbi:MAG: universal stress protein [Bacteroidetes bacterium]|jgi:nucleotide-binding universal stress UspA family protein|nr:universal stress protein [Bacteroidota bacterium]
MFDAPIIHSNMGLYGISYTNDRKQSEKKLIAQQEELQKQFPKLKINLFVSGGSMKKALKEFTSKHLVEAAVMGLKARDKISKFIYGSHGVDLAGKIDAPVIIVPERYTEHKFQKLLLAIDNSEKLSVKVRTHISRLSKMLKASADILYVRTEDELFVPRILDVTLNGAEKKIEIIDSKDMQTGIKNFVNKKNSDMIMIVSKRHSVFYNLFAESHTKKIAFVSSVPVMSIHE